MPTTIADLVEDMNEGIPMAGYDIDELPKPKKSKKQQKKDLEREDLQLPLQEHEWVNDSNRHL